jgi:hypothetical protein
MIRMCNVIMLALLSIVMVPAAFAQSASATVVAGMDHSREIHFGTWKPTNGMKKAQQNHFARFDFGSPYEFRKTAAITQEYLVAAVDGGFLRPPRDYSPNKFWVNLRSGKVRRATEAEWDSGVVVPQSRQPKSVFLPPKTEEGVLFQDRLFQKSGPQWPLITFEYARISPDEKWIAVQSWEGQDYGNGDIIAPQGGHGKFFVDLYEVLSGRKFVAIAGLERATLEADEPLGLTFWLESRYFILQLGSHLERMLACQVPT